MIDFYRGIDRDTDLVIPYLAELARKISPKRSANANYRSIEQLVEELGSREALNRSRPDDQALLEALEQAKRCFLNEDSKNSYDLAQLAFDSSIGLAFSSYFPLFPMALDRPCYFTCDYCLLASFVR